MLIKKENICRLCLNGVDGEFEVIDEVTREIFNILLLNVDVTTTKDPIVCTNCFDKIQTFFSFKSVCFSSEELIATYVRSKDVTPINIMDVFLKKPQPVDSVIYKAYNICRLCMYCGKGGNFFSLSALEGYIADEVIAKCIPEVNLAMTKYPMICSACIEHLNTYFNFQLNCKETETSINSYHETIESGGRIKTELNNVLTHIYKNCLEYDDPFNKIVIKKEKNEGEEYTLTDSLENNEEKIEVNDELSGSSNKHFKRELQFKDKDIIEEEIDIKEELIEKIDTVSRKYSPIKLEINDFEHKIEKTDRRIDKNNNILLQRSRPKEFQCNLCTFTSKYKSNLQRHQKHHRILVKRLKCNICPYEASHEKYIKRHYKLHHENNPKGKVLKCKNCSYETTNKPHLTRHNLLHKDFSTVTTFNCNICPYNTKWAYMLDRHINIHKEFSEVTLYACDLCFFATKHKYSYRNHLYTHKEATEIPMRSCKLCNFQTRHNESLKNHMLRHKNAWEISLYRCDKCGYKSKLKNNLRRHMKLHKNIWEVPTYKCYNCPYESKEKRNLIRHMVIHREPMYKCEVCSFRTRHATCIRDHMNFKHGNPADIVWYNCENCTFKTKYKDHLRKHTLGHISDACMYKCDMCNYASKFRYYLKLHMKKKHDEVRFDCELCEYSTDALKDFNLHLRLHNNGLK